MKRVLQTGLNFFRPVKDWCIIAFYLSYLERGNLSLVYMVNDLIKQSNHAQSGFYLNEYEKLFATLKELEKVKQKTIVDRVTFALLDFAEKYVLSLEHTIITETGGMKGQKRGNDKREVHTILKKSFGGARYPF